MTDTALLTRQKAGRPYYSQRKIVSRAVVPLVDGADPMIIMRFKGSECLSGVGLAGISNEARDVDIFIRSVGSTDAALDADTINLLEGGGNNFSAKGGNDVADSLYTVVHHASLGLDEDTEYEIVVDFTGSDLDSNDELAAVVDFLVA